MNRRNAVTLTEVLISIFVLSIGLMALLSLFPIGAAQMAQALKDQRTAECAFIAGSQGRILWRETCNDTKPNSPGNATFRDPSPDVPASSQRFAYAMELPNFNHRGGGTARPYALPVTVAPQDIIPIALPDMDKIPDDTDKARSSYPVFVDPIGWEANYKANATARMLWVGYPMVGSTPGTPVAPPEHGKRGLIPRRPLYVKNPDPTSAAQWIALGSSDPNNNTLNRTQRVLSRFSLLDDLTFDSDGLPLKANGMIERQGRYTWSYLFRRPNHKNRDIVEMTVVVYSGRSVDVPSPEEQFVTEIITDPRVVRINYAGRAKPALRRGSWILDATIFNNIGDKDPQGQFYRVTNVDDSVPNILTIDLQTQLIGTTPRRSIVVMENVVEVFPKGMVSSNSAPGDPTP
jgi:hypothetical protein